MTYSMGEMSAALSTLLGIRGDKRNAFDARIGSLLRVGLLDGKETIKGKTTFFTAEEALEVFCALISETTREHTIAVIHKHRDDIHRIAGQSPDAEFTFQPPPMLEHMMERGARTSSVVWIWPVGRMRRKLIDLMDSYRSKEP